ncbi:MAG: methyl-accepting chemotaxis protein [Pseudohongiellaceae bacterium]|jgi:methyl-accepting chemotaxis protein
MRLTVGLKIGGGFFLVTLMLIIAGGIGFDGALKLGGAVDYFAKQAWSSGTAASQFTSSIQKQTTILEKLTAGVTSLEEHENKALVLANRQAENAIEQIVNGGIVTQKQTDKLRSLYDKYKFEQKTLIQQHSNYAIQRNLAFSDFVAFQKFMKVLEFYSNNIYRLPNINQLDKFELVTSFFSTKLSLQTRFYFMQRFLGGDNRSVMLDEMESAWEDLIDESTELADLELTDVQIPDGNYTGNTYSSLINLQVNAHKANFDTLILSFDAYQKTKVDYETIKNNTLKNVNDFVSNLGVTINAAAVQSSSTKSRVYTAIIIAIIIGTLIAIAATIFCIVTVVKPIALAGRRMKEIASGDGDLTLSLPVNGNDEIAYLGINFNEFVNKVHNLISLTINISKQLTTSSIELQTLAKKTSQATTSQQDGSHQIAAALHEMTISFQEVAQSASNAESVTNETNVSVNSCITSVSKNRASIEELSADIAHASDVISQLEKESDSVGSILNVIGGIAEQTNLLALNAAIEAARAGEQGRGFAVVADEVRVLAQKTQKSTGEIKKVIEGLQQKSSEAVTVIDNSAQKALSSVSLANDVTEKLELVSSGVVQVFDMNALIAAATEEQSSVAEEINMNVTKISDLSALTSKDADSALASSQHLFDLVEEIHKVVGQFKV